MDRLDFAAIAAAVHRTGMAHGIGSKSPKEVTGGNRALRLLATDLAATLAHAHPGFDRAQFLADCGMVP